MSEAFEYITQQMSDGKVGQCTQGVKYSGQCRVELQWLGKG